MLRRLPVKMLLCCVLAIGMAGRPVLAQEKTDISSKKVSVKYENISIRTALKTLFETMKVEYTIHPSVKGELTTELNEVPFRVALEMMLRAVSMPPKQKFTYRIEEGVYHIFPSEGRPIPAPQTSTTPQTAPTKSVALKDRKVTVKFSSADLRTALASLFKSVEANYVIDDRVSGQVTASLKDMPFESALKQLLRYAVTDQGNQLTYRFVDNVYHVIEKPDAP